MLIGFPNLTVKACQCPELPALSKNYCDGFELIFKGTVISKSSCNKIAKVRMKLTELYKGISPEETDVYFDCEGDCAVNIAVGEEWIIYSNYFQLGKPQLKLCSRSRKFIHGEKEVETEFIPTSVSYQSERDFLEKELGLHHFLKTTTNSDMAHQNEKPSPPVSIVLILISMVVLIVFYYFFNKFFR